MESPQTGFERLARKCGPFVFGMLGAGGELMACERFTFPDGAHGIICTQRGRRLRACAFGRPGKRLCDFPTGIGRRTCSAPICGTCGVHRGLDYDLCTAHANATQAKPAQPRLPGL